MVNFAAVWRFCHGDSHPGVHSPNPRHIAYEYSRPASSSRASSTKADTLPSGGLWLHEIKHDGFRLVVRRDPAGVRLLTRNGHDWADRYRLIAEAAGALQGGPFLPHGGGVACDGDGMPVFDRLRYRRQDRHVFLYAFDLLELNGQDLRREPIEVRKLLRWTAQIGLQFNERRARRRCLTPCL